MRCHVAFFFQNAVKYGLYCKLRQVRFLLRLTLVARHQPNDERLIVVSQAQSWTLDSAVSSF